MFRCAAPPRIAYPLQRFTLLLSPIASRFVACPFLCFALQRLTSLSLSVAPCLLALRILCLSRRILAFPMRLLPCFAIPMHFSASPVPAMPKLFRARPKLFRTWRIHLLAFPHLSTPLLLTSVLCRCDSLRFGAFPTLFGSYPLLCVANQYHAQAILCCAKLCSSFASQCYANAKLGSSLPLHLAARLCPC